MDGSYSRLSDVHSGEHQGISMGHLLLHYIYNGPVCSTDINLFFYADGALFLSIFPYLSLHNFVSESVNRDVGNF